MDAKLSKQRDLGIRSNEKKGRSGKSHYISGFRGTILRRYELQSLLAPVGLLDKRGIRFGTADYSLAYHLTFLANERRKRSPVESRQTARTEGAGHR